MFDEIIKILTTNEYYMSIIIKNKEYYHKKRSQLDCNKDAKIVGYYNKKTDVICIKLDYVFSKIETGYKSIIKMNKPFFFN